MWSPAGLLLGAVPVLIFQTLPISSARTQGRVKWRHRIASAYIPVRPAVARDGTVYAVDISGTLHAVAADGKPKWTLAGAGRKGVSVGADGTVYTGDTTKVLAVNPNGTIKWTYRLAPVAHSFMGPTVGPDGNIYANGPMGPGVFSLTPAGKLRWSTVTPWGRPRVQNQELVFRPPSGNRGLQVLFSGNGILAQVEAKDGKMTRISSGGDFQPAIGPNGDLYSTGSLDLRAFQPDGKLRWFFRARQFNAIGDPTVGTDGTVHVVKLGGLFALRPSDGSTIWTHHDYSSLRLPMASPSTNPANRMILVGGRSRGGTDFMRAVDPRGALMWQVDLRPFGKVGPFPTTTARFTPDGNTAYFGTQASQTHCFLYALDTSPRKIAEVWTWGKACRGISTKLPVLGFTKRPVLNSTFSVDLSEARASAAAAHVMGFAPIRVDFLWLGAPGCLAYVRPDVVFAHKTDSLGRASSPLPVPNVPVLAGLKLYHQFVVADPVNRLGVVSTAGGASALGH